MLIKMEEKRNVNKKLLSIFRIYLKLIPIVIAIIYFLNTVLSYFKLYPKVLNQKSARRRD